MKNLEDHRHKIWIIGFVLRFLASPFELDTFDYTEFRRPIAIQLSEGKGLYKDVRYAHMPIYPYLSAMMVFLVGSDNKYLTGMAIKFPLVIADALIPIVLYRIGSRLNKQREGTLASIVYALNPISLKEITLIHWDGLASLFVLLTFYFMLQDYPLRTGIMVALGFFTKEFPLFMCGIIIVYWRHEINKLLKSIFSFFITSFTILGLVLLPFGTPINNMIDDLFLHPIYRSYEPTTQEQTNGPIMDTINIIIYFTDVNETILQVIWGILFFSLQLFPLIIYFKTPDESILIDIITLQITLLSIFFMSIHVQFLQWLLPWLLFWGFSKGGRAIHASTLITIGYLAYHLGFYYPDYKFYIRDFIIAVTGLWIIYQTVTSLARRRAIENAFTQTSKN